MTNDKLIKKLTPMYWLHEFGDICYKTDFFFLLKDSHKSKQYEWFIKEGYICEYTISNEFKSSRAEYNTFVSVNNDPEVREVLSNLFKDSSFMTSVKKVDVEKLHKSIHTPYLKNNMLPRLRRATALIMFHAAGVRIGKKEKPSLLYLKNHIREAEYPELINADSSGFVNHAYLDDDIERQNKTEHDTSASSSLCRSYLQDGIFYTKNEFFDFVKNIKGNSANDSYKSLPFNGIFINEGTVLVSMVTLAITESRIIYYKKAMNSFLEQLNELVVNEICPNAKRVLNGYENIYSDMQPFQYGVGAIVISRGSVMPTAMTLRARAGVRGNGFANLEKARTSKKSAIDYVDSACSNFDMIFSVSRDMDGISQLNYICNHSIESWREEAAIVLAEANDNESVGLDFEDITSCSNHSNEVLSLNAGYTTLRNTLYKTLFLPVIEIKMLDKLHELALQNRTNYLVLTYANLFDTVSHCLRLGSSQINLPVAVRTPTSLRMCEIQRKEPFKCFIDRLPAHVYDNHVKKLNESAYGTKVSSIDYTEFEITRLAKATEYYIYNSNGVIDGKVIFDEWLFKNKKQEAVYKGINKTDLIQIFNSISTGTASCENVYKNAIKKVDITYDEYQEEESKSHSTVHLVLPKETKDQINKLAMDKNISIRKYIRNLIDEHLNQMNNDNSK